MKVILLEAIAKLGELGDAVEVKPGYARNYLIPQRKAVRATAEAMLAVENRRAQLIKEEKERLDVAKARAESAVKALTIPRRVIDEEGRLFGSVAANDIVQAAEELNTEILRSEILMPEGNIKNTGEFTIPVVVHPEVRFEINVTVVADDQVQSLEQVMDEAEAAGDEASESETENSDSAQSSETEEASE